MNSLMHIIDEFIDGSLSLGPFLWVPFFGPHDAGKLAQCSATLGSLHSLSIPVLSWLFHGFFMVVHCFFMVFHGFSKELDFKELEIHQYSLMDIHQ